MKPAILLGAIAIFLTACQRPASDPLAGKWVDLTHEFSEETIYWVTAEPFKRTTVAEGKTDKGFYYSAYNFSGAEHGGTHLDSPIHFAEGKKTADQIALNELIGPGVKVDVSAKASANRDFLISVDDITDWETANGEIADGSIVLFSTGYAKQWPDLQNYLGTDKKGPEAVKDLHFPGLHPDAAKWLVQNRRIKAVGIDTASIDFGQATLFESHVALMTNNIPAFENVGDMSELPPKGFYVFAFPMKIKGGSGGPLRIAALVQAK